MEQSRRQECSLALELERRRSETATEVKVERVRLLSGESGSTGGKTAVVYWMSRDCRVQDNWAMLYAQRTALANRGALYVCFDVRHAECSYRKASFVIGGLREVERECAELNINFYVVDDTRSFVLSHEIGTLVCDFSPLREHREAVSRLVECEDTVLYQVDAHNVVPVWITSNKAETAARTIRPKIHGKLEEYLQEFPGVQRHPYDGRTCGDIDYVRLFDLESLRHEDTKIAVTPQIGFEPGYMSGVRQLELFFAHRLDTYSKERNNPSQNTISDLSPWVHFGQIAPQRCVLLAFEHRAESFIEEMLVRRELSDNFCYYNTSYDRVEGAPEWARISLDKHRHDTRTHIYTKDEFERAETHDELWNAAQVQMMRFGKMHGFLRMYWAKKILEWTESAEVALEIALELNDKYNLDGHDPNGFVGCMWSICGVHDQGWREREVFGKIRYMNLEGCKRKFDVEAFISMMRK